MPTKSKLVLGATILCFLGAVVFEFGIVATPGPAIHVLLPVGAILLGFLIVTRLFEKESPVPVRDHERANEQVGPHAASDPRNTL